MTHRKIDLAAVRLARANLRRLAAEHPELTTATPGPANVAAWGAILEEQEQPTMSRPKGDPTATVSLRLPSDLLDRIDRMGAKIAHGVSVARNAIIRALIERGLTVLEHEADPMRAILGRDPTAEEAAMARTFTDDQLAAWMADDDRETADNPDLIEWARQKIASKGKAAQG